jgi:hypothetical protein
MSESRHGTIDEALSLRVAEWGRLRRASRLTICRRAAPPINECGFVQRPDTMPTKGSRTFHTRITWQPRVAAGGGFRGRGQSNPGGGSRRHGGEAGKFSLVDGAVPPLALSLCCNTGLRAEWTDSTTLVGRDTNGETRPPLAVMDATASPPPHLPGERYGT